MHPNLRNTNEPNYSRYSYAKMYNNSYCILSSLLLFKVNSSSSVNFEGNPPKSTSKCWSFFTYRKSVSLSCIKYKNYLKIQINHLVNRFQNNNRRNEQLLNQNLSKKLCIFFAPWNNFFLLVLFIGEFELQQLSMSAIPWT